MRTNTRQLWTILGILFAGMCLFRVFTVSAEENIEEIYENDRRPSSYSDDVDTRERDEMLETQRAEIRLSRPSEAAARIEEEEGQVLVRGVQELWAREQVQKNNDAVAKLSVPNKSGPAIGRHVQPSRGLASDSSDSLTTASAMEPAASMSQSAPLTMSPAKKMPYGFADQRPAQPLPDVANRGGVQEVSIVVSDYGFFPNRVPVIAGVPVKVYLATTAKQTMCFMVDEVGVKKGISPGKVEEVVFTPVGTGTIRFYCPMKSIEGWLVVKEALSEENATRGIAADTRDLEPVDEVGFNTPKNANRLRALIED